MVVNISNSVYLHVHSSVVLNEDFIGVFLLQSVELGDVVVGVVTSIVDSGLVIQLLCFDQSKNRDIDDLHINVRTFTLNFTCSIYIRDDERFVVMHTSLNKLLLILTFVSCQ